MYISFEGKKPNTVIAGGTVSSVRLFLSRATNPSHVVIVTVSYRSRVTLGRILPSSFRTGPDVHCVDRLVQYLTAAIVEVACQAVCLIKKEQQSHQDTRQASRFLGFNL